MIILKSLKGAKALAVSAALVVLGSSFANAALLNPGSTITLRSAHEPEEGHLLAQTNFTFTSTAFTGTLTSKVWENDESNPWGGLTFTYKLANNSDCRESLGTRTARTSLGASPAPSVCTNDDDCAPGHACVNLYMTGPECARWCNAISGSGCSGAENCYGFMTPLIVSGIEYGVCRF